MRVSALGAGLALTFASGSRVVLGACVAVAAFASCGDGKASSAGAAAPSLPWRVSPFPEIARPTDDAPSEAKVELGRLLFHDPILSADRKVACVTCHSQYWGMSDGLPFSIGVGGVGPAGLGRTGPTHARRNARTLWNAAYRRALFWDGRASSLEEQVLVPLMDPVELARVPAELVVDLAAIGAYRDAFVGAFPGDADPVSLVNVQRALATFVRTIVSNDAPYDRFARGDANALSPLEVRGMEIFADAGCASCHAPPLFESERYAAIGVGSEADLGRFEVTGRDEDRGAFRVPTLRNLRDTGPYFHDGSAATLEDAVAKMAASKVVSRVLALDERDAVSAFLRKSLVDRLHEPERPHEVPSGLPVPPDGYRIAR